MQTVRTTIKREGFHFWPDAPDEVAFLRSVHRHLFHITAEVEVDHNNRDVEFFILQRTIASALPLLDATWQVFDSTGGPSSCEKMAEAIARFLVGKQYNVVMVEVSEDGESAGRWYCE